MEDLMLTLRKLEGMSRWMWYFIEESAKWTYHFMAGLITAVLGYFMPIKHVVHMVIFFFFVDMMVGYWAARKLRHERFNVDIVWTKTFPRMALSLLIIILCYILDTTCNQNSYPTYIIISYAISGMLIFSIVINAYKITNWRVFKTVTDAVEHKIEEETGVKFQKD